MAAPVATARTLNGVQDAPIDSDDVPYYRAKTGVVVPFGFAGTINALVAFVSRATRGDVDVVPFTPQGLFVGAFVKPATRADVDETGFVAGLGIVKWLTLPAFSYDRNVGGTQFINAIRATYLVDPISQIAPSNVTVI